MNSRDAHQHRLHSHPQAELNGASSMEAQNEELEEMGMRTDLRAGSPCRQAASEIMEDLSMDTRMNEQTYSEAFRRDMLNVFPGHPALPQQTPPFRGEGLTQEHNGSGPTIIRDYGPSKSMFEFGPPTIPENEPLFEDQQMVSDQQLLTEPDWITQMLEQVQKVGLWNEPFSMEPLRPDLPQQITTSTASTQPVQAMDISDPNPIPFYKQNMESLMNLPSGCSDVTTELLVPQAPAVELQIPGVPSTVAPSTVPPAQAQPPLQNLGKSFSMPSSSGGIGVINQSQRPTTEEYVNILKNALSIPGMGAALNRESTVSLELSKDGMNEVIESSRQKSMNDGPFRPPTRQHTCGRLAGMRSMDSGCSNPMLQQSELQLQLGLAADSPIDLRHWGYGEAARNSDDVKPAEKRMKTSDCVQTMGTSTEVAQRIMATSAGSVPSAGPSNVLQEGTDVKQQSPLSGGLERLQQASDRKSGLSADEVTRLESLERYREKKRRRLHTKTIRYYKRKVNADARKRYKGRFVKAESAGQDNMGFSNDRVTDASSYHSMSAEVSDLKTV